MRIVHLSDIHYSSKQKNFKLYITTPLLEDLKNIHSQSPVDLIIFTGDLLDKGGIPDNILNAFDMFDKEFIEPVMSTLSLSKDRFIFIPGNHDIERPKVNPATEGGLRKFLNSADAIYEYMENPHHLNMERIQEYKNFEAYYYDENEGYLSNQFGHSIVTEIDGLTIGIAGFNSAWRCYDDGDEGNLIVGRKQFEDVDEHFKKYELDLKIAMLHHPIEHLSKADMDETRERIIRDYEILFTGHTHQSKAQSITTSLGKGCVMCAAPSNWEKNNYLNHGLNRNGYNVIDYFHAAKQMKIHFRRYNYEKNLFIANTDLGKDDSAEAIFELGDSSMKAAWIEYYNTIKFIKDRLTDSINQNLVSYNTDTKAPKKLEDIFVLPQIVEQSYQASNTSEFVDYEANKNLLTVDEMANYPKNLILFGPNESGKTTILYRVAQELLNNSTTEKKIPIYIDLKTFSGKSLFKGISSFIGQGNKQTETTLLNYKILLLLDDCRYLIINKKLSEELELLINTYPQLTILGTYNSLSEESLPSDYLNHPISKYFETAVIKYFRTTEIQNLMHRWFGMSVKETKDEHLNQLIKNFHLLNIPSTPLAVSLFLWIYEKQKGFIPLNNAAMMQNFVEKLFEKHSNHEIYSSDFDFHNKENLLGHIAIEMLKSGQVNYSLEENKLKEFIRNLNKRKKIGLENNNSVLFHEWVITHFVDKGLFISEVIEDNRFYRFKLNCFFQYYLAKGMTFSKKFKDFVLDENNYLMFQEEIDYYSGLHRFDGEILELLLSRMESEFIEVVHDKKAFKDILDNKDIISFDQMFAKGPEYKEELLVETFEDENQVEEHLDENKLSEEEKAKRNDFLLESSNMEQDSGLIINKIPQSELSRSEILQYTWILVAKVLKNAEDLEDGDLKDRAFRNTLTCSLLFLKHTLDQIKQVIKDSQQKEHLEFYAFFSRFSLLFHQNVLFSVMGTSKLTPVIEDFMKNKESISNVELFISMFLNMDAGSDSLNNEFSLAIQDNMSSAVREFVLVKLQMLDALTNDTEKERFYRSKINAIRRKNQSGYSVRHKQKVISKQESNQSRKNLIETLSQK
ncbi:metallophosphoesterase [Sporosarcina sp. FSL W7-1283]|uniref:metallophosphoesterase n=1 Tax=Sporosarcina sp. FSL W7-1283 TaxID=2921560 RepID=UPI0030F9E1F2